MRTYTHARRLLSKYKIGDESSEEERGTRSDLTQVRRPPAWPQMLRKKPVLFARRRPAGKDEYWSACALPVRIRPCVRMEWVAHGRHQPDRRARMLRLPGVVVNQGAPSSARHDVLTRGRTLPVSSADSERYVAADYPHPRTTITD